jgi:hypothetical protein
MVLLALSAAVAPAQTPAFTVRPGTSEQGWAAQVQIGPILDDAALRDALESALPLRFHLRIELWRNGFLDRLIGSDERSVAILQDPLTGEYAVESASSGVLVSTLAEAQAALRDLLRSTLRPQRSGRHYYLAVLEVETLSLSDLDELRRWLRGDVGAALEGRAPPARAVERGLRRLLVRVIGLPTRRFEASSGTFTAG